MKTLLYAIGWTLSGMLVLLIGGVVVLVVLGLISTPIGWLLLPAAVAIRLCYRQFNRRQRAASAMNYIEQGMAAGLPMSQLLAGLSRDDQNAKTRRAAREACKALAQGTALGHVIAQGVDGLNRREITLLRNASRTGQVNAAVRRITSTHSRHRDYQIASLIAGFTYPIVLLTFAVLLVGSLMVFILPKFGSIFEDFDVPLPYITTTLGYFSQARSFSFLDALLGFIILSILASLLTTLAFAGKLGWLMWWLPGGRRLERSRSLADTCFVLSQSLDAGATMPQAVSHASDIAVNPFMRRKLRTWAARVTAGEDAPAAARHAGLPTLVSGMMATGRNSGELPATLLFLQRHYDAQFSRIVLMFRSVFPPLLLLLVALVVGYVVLGMFLPLVYLITSLIPVGAMP